jgi:hypothetical protein
MSDDRKGYPSASAAERWVNCPGSHLAQEGLGEQVSDDANEGRMLHLQVESGVVCDDLTDDQKWAVRYCIETTSTLCERYLDMAAGRLDALMLTMRETRLWSFGEDFYYSGQADFIANDGAGRILIIDYKFGRNAVANAGDNLQLAALAVLAAENSMLKVQSVTVAIVQPRADEDQRLTVASYTPAGIAEASRRLRIASTLAKRPNQHRNAGAWCKYCRALATCPVAHQQVTVVAESSADLSVADLLDRCEMAEVVIKSIREKAKATLAEGGHIPGWTLKPGAMVAKVTDPVVAWQRIGPVVGGDAFAAACSVSLPTLVDAYKASQGVNGKLAREQVVEMLGDAIETRQNAPALKRESVK